MTEGEGTPSGGTPPPNAPELAVPQPDEDKPSAFADDPGDAMGAMAGGSARALSRLLKTHPFMDVYDRVARDTKDRNTKALRALKVACATLDILFRLTAHLLLLAIIAAVAWKTLAPFPSLPWGK